MPVTVSIIWTPNVALFALRADWKGDPTVLVASKWFRFIFKILMNDSFILTIYYTIIWRWKWHGEDITQSRWVEKSGLQSLPCKLPSTVCLHHTPGTLVQLEITWSLISRTKSKQNRCFLRVPATKTLHSPLSTGLVSTVSFPFSDKELFHWSNVANHEYYHIWTSGSSASFRFGGLFQVSELLIF